MTFWYFFYGFLFAGIAGFLTHIAIDYIIVPIFRWKKVQDKILKEGKHKEEENA